MFETKDHKIIDDCFHCRWQFTEMCPKSKKYVGRIFSSEERLARNQICHRFVMTQKEKERRWNQVMEKLQENLGPNMEEDWPF